MSNNQTDLTIKAKASGFAEVQQQAAKIGKEASKAIDDQIAGFKKVEKSTKAYQAQVKGLEGTLGDLAKQQLVTIKAMEQLGKGSDAYKKLDGVLGGINEKYKAQERMLHATNRAMKETAVTAKQLSSGGFGQGLMMGAAPGMGFIQRGPGMQRQMAGQAIGRMGRGMAQGIGGAAFGGVSGMQSMLGGIPVVGGALSGQLGTAMGFAQGALGLQGQQLSSASLIAGGGIGDKIEASRQQAMRGVPAPAGGFMSSKDIEERAAAKGASVANDMVMTKKMKINVARDFNRAFESQVRNAMNQPGHGSRTEENNRLWKELSVGFKETLIFEEFGKGRQQAREKAIAAETETLSAPQRVYSAKRSKAGSRAAAKARNDPFKAIYSQGLALGGLNQQQALESVMGMLQAGGGTMTDVKDQGMLGASFAAKTAYGVDAGTSGAFLKAGRRGGLTGARGQGGAALARTIDEGRSLGLSEGSETTAYLAQIAQGISSFEQTGIPINSKSISNLGGEFAKSGMGGVRGRVLGGGIQRAAQGLTQRGIQSSTDLLMAQTLGGFKGGGMDDYENSMIQLESGKFGEGPEGKERLKSFVGKLMKAGGGGATGRQVVRKGFAGLGVSMGVAETKSFTKSIMGGEMTAEETAQAAQVREEMAGGVKGATGGVAGLKAQADDILKGYGGAVKRAAALQNEQNRIGATMLPAMQNLQDSALNINKLFTALADEGIAKMSGKMEDFTKNLSEATTGLELIAKISSLWTF